MTPLPRARAGLVVVLAWSLLLAGCTREPAAHPHADMALPTSDMALPTSDIDALDAVFSDTVLLAGGDFEAFTPASDPRVAWPLVDLLRFHQASARVQEVQAAIARVADLPDGLNWVEATDALLRADLPAFPGYLGYKAAQYLTREPGWAPFFDETADLDYRLVSWGGVPRDGISPLDDPDTVPAGEGWIPEDEEVFGVVVDGQARAYPRRVLEVHELVNDMLGGTRLSLPYCTLCGTATAYDVSGLDGVDGGPPRLLTSGLLLRSNKLMYDEATESLFTQFGGIGLSGPLQGVRLPRLPVTAVSWGDWRAAHPDTTIVARDAGDRRYEADPLGGRDDDGPIFPVGEIDARLGAQVRVLATTTADGTPVAFAEQALADAIDRDGSVTFAGVRATRVSGLVELFEAETGEPLTSQVAFWFAWSQFRPATRLWEG